MSSYKNKNKKRLQIEDEIIPDSEYFSGQQNYWSVVQHNKNIRIRKVKVILKNVSTSSAYRKYIETFPISKCKTCMGCLRIKPCLCCYICKNLDTQLCSKNKITGCSKEVLHRKPINQTFSVENKMACQ